MERTAPETLPQAPRTSAAPLSWELAAYSGIALLVLLGARAPEWPATLTAFGASLLVGAWAWPSPRGGIPPLGGGLIAGAGLLALAIGLVQMVPLPPAVLGAVDPATVALRESLDIPPPGAAPTLSLSPAHTRLALLGFALPLVLLLGGPWLLGERKAPERALRVLAGVAAVAGLAALGDWAGIGVRQREAGRGSGTFGNPNHLVDLLTIGFGASLALAARIEEPLVAARRGLWTSIQEFFLGEAGPKRSLAILAAACAAVGVAATISRGGLAVFLAAVLAIAAWYGAKRRPWLAASTLLLLALGIGMAALAFRDVLGVRLANALEASGEGNPVAFRMALWSEWVAVAIAHPFLGVGVGTFEAVHPMCRMQDLWVAIGTKYAYHADGDLAEVLGEMGFVGGGLVVLLAVAGWFVLFHRTLCARDRRVEALFPLVVALGAVLLHEGFDFGLRKPPVAAGFALAVAVIGATLRGAEVARVPAPAGLSWGATVRTWAFRVAAGAAALTVGWVALSAGMGRYEADAADEALDRLAGAGHPMLRSSAFVEARAACERAAWWDDLSARIPFIEGRAYEEALLAGGGVDLPLDVLYRMRECHREAIRRQPTEGRYHLHLASVHVRLADISDAASRLDRALALDPCRGASLFAGGRLCLDIATLAPTEAWRWRPRGIGLLRLALTYDAWNFAPLVADLLGRREGADDLLDEATPSTEPARTAFRDWRAAHSRPARR